MAPEPPVLTTEAPPPPTVTRYGSVNDQRFLIDCYREYGPIFRLPQKGELARKEGDEFVVLSGPEANAFAMKTTNMHQGVDGSVKLRSDNHWEEFSKELGMDEFTREGDMHMRHRTLTGRGYARTTITGRMPEVVAMARSVTSRWTPGQVVPAVRDIQHIVSEQLGRTLIGYSPAAYIDDLVTFVRTTKLTMLLRTRTAELLADPAYERARMRVFEIGYRAIVARLETPADERPGDLLDDLLSVWQPPSPDKLQPLLIAATIGPFLAGLETASYRTGYLLHLLLEHPGVLARVRTEVDEWFAGPLTWDRLKTCRALYGGMMEALRLYPGPARQWYTAEESFVFHDHLVAKGDSVIVVYDTSHHLAELFPDPAAFDVDRYRAPRNEHRNLGAFAPFGVGGHTCLGSGMAEVQVMLNVATMLHDWDLAPDPTGFDPDADADEALRVHVAGPRDR
ncbi:cytochrome P450 [Sphaerisporangium rubeum]|uniref:Cytochrome P450 n=1 Tax=Sphaerisporangium rubeum TaxID=321317 RepID=A0A7X0M7M1_9ACTN|nr:cytochrome P450 [Sphaerisporangium rubeum]MBB6474933.1 cytochrome P450 [Sphaerisporangium rubeum]